MNHNGISFPGGRPSPIPRPTSLASVHSTAYSETDHSEILSPTPRRHYLIQQQSSNWLQSAVGSVSPPISRPSSPLNPNHAQLSPRKHKVSLSFSSLAEHRKPKGGKVAGLNGSLARRWVRWMHRSRLGYWVLPCQILFAVLIKWSVGLGSYSGENTPPMYGDYEAQRHWLEITYHLPVRLWYKYDLQYWGLDYPPLTAYVSWLCGFIAHKINPEWVALDDSRGIGSATSKVYMRFTVLILDLLIYIPALVQFARNSSLLRHRSAKAKDVALATILLQPALILIDSGHFQYNSVMLGFTLHSLNFFSQGRDLLGAFCFVASLGFKQMALYYAPVVFAYLLGKCLLLGWKSGVPHLASIGFITIAGFTILFLPFLSEFPTHLIPPIQRIFPFARGLFEDKVGNFWCASNVFIKWNRHFSKAVLPKLATGFTAIAFMPSMIALFAPAIKGFGTMEMAGDRSKSCQPSPTFALFTHALFQTSLSFFLFSFQVHEKTILVPLLPLTLLMVASAPTVEGGDWEWGVLLNNMACFSMWPLLRRDGLTVQYIGLLSLWNYAIGHNPLRQSSLRPLTLFAYSAAAVIQVAELLITPPTRYPDLFPVLNALLSAGVFGLAYLWSLKRLVEISWAMGTIRTSTITSTSAPSSLRPILEERRYPSSKELFNNFVSDSAAAGGGNDASNHTISLSTHDVSSLRKRHAPLHATSEGQAPLSAGVVDLTE